MVARRLAPIVVALGLLVVCVPAAPAAGGGIQLHARWVAQLKVGSYSLLLTISPYPKTKRSLMYWELGRKAVCANVSTTVTPGAGGAFDVFGQLQNFFNLGGNVDGTLEAKGHFASDRWKGTVTLSRVMSDTCGPRFKNLNAGPLPFVADPLAVDPAGCPISASAPSPQSAAKPVKVNVTPTGQPCAVEVDPVIDVPGGASLLKAHTVKRKIARGKRTKLKLSLSTAQRARVHSALRHGAKVRLHIRIVARDAHGQKTTKRLVVRLVA
jgi:hypothetical protein